MSLADQIIKHEPWDAAGFAYVHSTGAELNALRDELLELQRLRTAAEARERVTVEADCNVNDMPLLRTVCDRCGIESEHDGQLRLAELLRRADQHGEECT